MCRKYEFRDYNKINFTVMCRKYEFRDYNKKKEEIIN